MLLPVPPFLVGPSKMRDRDSESPLHSRPDFAYLSAIDARWAALVEAAGPALAATKAIPYEHHSPYEGLLRAVSHQQLHRNAAEAILGRLRAAFEKKQEGSARESNATDERFPTPEELLSLDIETLRGYGFSARKAATLRAIAEGAIHGLVPTRAHALACENETLIKTLTAIPGIGRWTVEMLLIDVLGRTDICPVDDFGVRDGYRRLWGLETLPTPKMLRTASEAWAPWRTTASRLLWRVPR